MEDEIWINEIPFSILKLESFSEYFKENKGINKILEKCSLKELPFNILKVFKKIIYNQQVEKDELSIARGGDVGVLKDYKPTGWRSRSKKPAGNIKTSKSEGMQKLDLNNNLAKKIYDKAEDIWSKTNRNVKSTARGGKSRSSGWKWKI